MIVVCPVQVRQAGTKRAGNRRANLLEVRVKQLEFNSKATDDAGKLHKEHRVMPDHLLSQPFLVEQTPDGQIHTVSELGLSLDCSAAVLTHVAAGAPP